MTRSFDYDAASAFHSFRNAVERFKGDDLNQDLARDCAIKAWQLCDHVFKALSSTSRFTKLRDLQDHAKQGCPELAYLQDVCTETKHGEITRYVPHIDKARYHKGAFSRDFSHDFDISCLEIKLRSGRTILFNDVLECAVVFWSEFFQDNGIR